MKYELVDPVCKPERSHPTDAGVDLKARVSVILPPLYTAEIPLGIKTEIPEGYVALLLPRSGLGSRGLVLRNTVGVIDSDYRGEWIAKVKNSSDNNVIELTKGDRICQAIIVPCNLSVWEESNLSETVRGEGGFGSTGAN